MVEVFKTNVQHKELADQLVSVLQGRIDFCKINFDLEDCDRILRVANQAGTVLAEDVIYFLRGFDFHAEVLPDDVSGVSELDMMMRYITQN